MFILIFVVFFGPKKGTLAAYSWCWSSILANSNQLIAHTISKCVEFEKTFKHKSLFRFQHTAITSRTTIYLLCSFWFFFFFFGESLLMLVLNYNTLSDLIPSAFFNLTKSHSVFMTSSGNAYLSETIFFFICFFTTTSLTFLLSMRYTLVYSYHSFGFRLDLISTLLLV